MGVVGNVLVIEGGFMVDRNVGKVGRGEKLVTCVTGVSEVSVPPGIVLVGIGDVKVTVGKSDESDVEVIGGAVIVCDGNVDMVDGVLVGKVVLVNVGGVNV